MEQSEENDVFNLLYLKIDCISYRYIIVGPLDAFGVETPLFLGVDLLSHSGIAKSNQCRIHNRYAKRGLATKLIFPEGVSVSGLNNCQSGFWFYNVQGVFNLIFEHQDRQCQLNLAPVLFDMWRTTNACPSLPERLELTLAQLYFQPTTPFFEVANLSNDDGDPASQSNFQPSSFVLEPLILISDQEEVPAETIREKPPLDVPTIAVDSVNSLWFLCGEILNKVEAHDRTCSVKEKLLTRALIAFLKLVRDECKQYGIKDVVMASFLKLIVDYASVLHDSSKMRQFGTSWGVVDGRQNALLCLIAEWFGKYMNSFEAAVADRVLKFKSENIDVACDLPPADVLIDELFPKCMRLLVGHWIGIYGSQSQLNVMDDTDLQKRRLMVKQGNRADHSYFSQKENCVSPSPVVVELTTTATTAAAAAASKRADHNYFSLPTTTDTSSVRSCQSKDHNYEAKTKNNKMVQTLPRVNRKDHTYVTMNTDVRGCNEPQTPPSKRLKTSDDNPCHTTNDSSGVVVIDSTKYSVVQLVLEFLNNSLVSGVAHVVHMRLRHL